MTGTTRAAASGTAASGRATSRAANGCHLYGIVPAATRGITTSAPGRATQLVRHGEVAGLIRSLPQGGARLTARDLREHAETLDRLASNAPVLPIRFGTTLASAKAVRREVLEPHHDTFAAALAELAGRVQFTVRATYLEDVPLREVLAENPRAMRLHRQAYGRGRPDPAGQLRLGELVAGALAAKREADAAVLADTLRPHVVACQIQMRQSSDPASIAEAAVLVDLRRQRRFEAATEDLASEWRDRVRLRLLGPMAAYHFADELVASMGGDPWG